MPSRMRFTAGQMDQVIAGAVSSGRIAPGRADSYRAALSGGGTRGGRVISQLLAMFPAGRRLGPHPVSAAARDEEIWTALFGRHQGADPDAADRREASPLTPAEFAKLYPDSPAAPADQGPLIPDLAGYTPGVRMLTPDDQIGPQLDMASAPRRVAADQLGGVGIVEHGEISAWHTHAHAHPGSDLNGHSHQQGSAGSHAIGPGHDHDAPEEFAPEMASGRPRRRTAPPAARPFTLATGAQDRAARVVAAAAASPSVRVPWPPPAARKPRRRRTSRRPPGG